MTALAWCALIVAGVLGWAWADYTERRDAARARMRPYRERAEQHAPGVATTYRLPVLDRLRECAPECADMEDV